MKKILTLCVFLLYIIQHIQAQIDPSLLKDPTAHSKKDLLNMDAIYDRPFVTNKKAPVSLGGYVEANWQHIGTDGVSDGHQLQFRRMTLFVASSISKRIKFLSEIEFEPADKEIAIEFAAVDMEFNELFNLRGGMIINPIGAFNQNHDGPKWEFTDRPLSSVSLLPATWSNAGFGIYGKKYNKNWMIGYEIYASSGFDNSIIENSENKTFLPTAKKNTERFEELPSGTPLYTTKVAIRHSKIGEIGLSYMGGIYNKWQDDGLVIDEKRSIHVFAVDFNTTLPKTNTFITTECAWVNVDIPITYSEQFGNKQFGGFLDIVQPVVKRTIAGWKDAVINIAVRFEYVDWNKGQFIDTGSNIGDHLWSIMPAVSFRPNSQSVLRLNYRIQKQTDVLGNPPSNTAGFNFGLSTYF